MRRLYQGRGIRITRNPCPYYARRQCGIRIRIRNPYYARRHARTHARTRARARARAQIRVRARTQIRTLARARKHTHTHTHTIQSPRFAHFAAYFAHFAAHFAAYFNHFAAHFAACVPPRKRDCVDTHTIQSAHFAACVPQAAPDSRARARTHDFTPAF